MNPEGGGVRLYIASFNTAAATELAIRSAIRHADIPFGITVGDSSSSDDSRKMLEHLAEQGMIELEVADQPRLHAHWLDHWLDTCQATFAVFADSDIEFLRRGWLERLIEVANGRSADLVYSETLRGWPAFTTPRNGEIVALAPRPAPWLFLARVDRARAVGASFAEVTFRPSDSSRPTTYDVGGLFFRRAVERGLSWQIMPHRYRSTYRHYGGLSWHAEGAPHPRSLERSRRLIDLRLERARALDADDASEAARHAAGASILSAGQRISDLGMKAAPGRWAPRIQRWRDTMAHRLRD